MKYLLILLIAMPCPASDASPEACKALGKTFIKASVTKAGNTRKAHCRKPRASKAKPFALPQGFSCDTDSNCEWKVQQLKAGVPYEKLDAIWEAETYVQQQQVDALEAEAVARGERGEL
jgi:hypothetical protein